MIECKSRTDRNLFVPLVSAALLLAGAMSTVPAVAAMPADDPPQEQAAAAEPADPGSMQERCREMMAEREKMMQKRQAMDAELDELMRSVHSAAGDAKVEAMEDLLEALVSQRRAMRSMMMQGHGPMMGHMMQHMRMMHAEGGMEMGGGRMANCPMMKEMMAGAMAEGEPEAEEDHTAHHPE